jgi:exopolysaccharide production protein ExoQ
MNVYQPKWRLSDAYGSNWAFTLAVHRSAKDESSPEPSISHEVLSWLLFWPVLSLIARQAVYFAGPARTAEVFQNGAAMAGGRSSHHYLYVDLLFLLGFVLAGYRQVWARLRGNLLLLASLALAVCSAAWSASPSTTVLMCIEVGLCTLFACYMSTRYTTERLMQFLIFMGVASALLSIFFALALPSYGIFQGYGGDAWQGICNQKNTLGVSMVFLLSPVFFTKDYARRQKIMYGALILFLIYKSQSRGAWSYTAGMLLFVAGLSLARRLRAWELTLLTLIVAAIGLATVALGVYYWPLVAAHLGKDATMTGRTAIYAEVWRSILKHPILGYGFGGFWGGPESQRVGLAIGWPNIGYAENGILDLALQTGFVGVGLVVAMIGTAMVQGLRLVRSSHYSPRAGWFLTILFVAVLTNIDAGWFMTFDTLDWMLIVIACIGLNDEMRRKSQLTAQVLAA